MVRTADLLAAPAALGAAARGTSLRIDARQPLSVLLAALLLLNLFDGLMTLLWVSLELTEEANPLMAVALELHPAVFMAAKLALIGGGVALLERRAGRRDVALATGSMVALYYWVALHHAWFWGWTQIF